MAFEVNFNGRDYRYDLGDERAARDACRGLELYKRSSNYGDLRRIFADLSSVVSEGNAKNREACLATNALGQSVLRTLNSYQKLFVACSVTSIYVRAQYPIPTDWMDAQVKCTALVKENFDRESMLSAGLAFIDVRSGKTLIPPTPEYSS